MNPDDLVKAIPALVGAALLAVIVRGARRVAKGAPRAEDTRIHDLAAVARRVGFEYRYEDSFDLPHLA